MSQIVSFTGHDGLDLKAASSGPSDGVPVLLVHGGGQTRRAWRRAADAIAAQGYRFRVPYGTLLCVSDKPLHGELKLPGQANRFYERAIAEHMLIGIEACRQLKAEGAKLHSRKLRAFNEPPFR